MQRYPTFPTIYHKPAKSVDPYLSSTATYSGGNSWVFPGAVIADNAYVSGNAVIEPSFSNPSLMSENIVLVGASMNQQALAALAGTLTERDKGASYFNHQNAALYTWDGIKFVQTRLTLRDAGRTYFNPENNVIHRWNGAAFVPVSLNSGNAGTTYAHLHNNSLHVWTGSQFVTGSLGSVQGSARVYGNAFISGGKVDNNARVLGNAMVMGDALISDEAAVAGNALITNNYSVIVPNGYQVDFTKANLHATAAETLEQLLDMKFQIAARMLRSLSPAERPGGIITAGSDLLAEEYTNGNPEITAYVDKVEQWITAGLQAATPKMTPSRILGRSRVQGSCVIAGGTIKDDARISGCAFINGIVKGQGNVSGGAFVDTKSVVKDNARLSGCASLIESILDRNAVVYGNEEIVAEAIGDASKVTNCPDKARGGNSDCCQQHQGIMFDAVLVDLDGLAATVMFTTTGTEIMPFTINWGDGTPASPVTPPAAHTSSVPGTYVATRNYGSAGTRVVTVFASEDTTNRMQIEITVGNGESWRKLE